MEVDTPFVRSVLYLMSLDEILECSNFVNTELLDILQVFILKAHQDISFTNFEVSRTFDFPACITY